MPHFAADIICARPRSSVASSMSARARTLPPLAAELRDHLHKLAGTAGSFGDCAVGRAAAEGEALLLAARAADLRTAVRRSYALLKAAG